MAKLNAFVVAATTMALLAGGPAAGYAQADESGDVNAQTVSEASGPTLDCSAVGLRIMAAEVSGASFACRIVGVPAGDSSFTVQATSATDQTHTLVPLCSGTLASGAGACSGAFIDRATSGLAQVSLAVTLQPSGAALGPIVIGPPAQAPAGSERMQFYPLPEP